MTITPIYGSRRLRALLQGHDSLSGNVTGLNVDYEMAENTESGVTISELGNALQSPAFTTEVGGIEGGIGAS